MASRWVEAVRDIPMM